ncbi:unnamed protein product, partial [Discosporangium mesarthrocarpum]
QHGSIEEIITHLDSSKYPIPDDWLDPMYLQARSVFLNPEVTAAGDIKLKWTDPDETGLLKFLVEEKGFNAERVASGISKLKDARKNTSQKRVDR